MVTVPAFDPAQFPGDVTLDHVIPARSPDTTPLPADLRPELAAALGSRGVAPPPPPHPPPPPAARRPELAAALGSRGVDRLYSHQAEAYAHVRAGRNVVV